ncbi:MAG: hypothetical protein NDI69_13485 [Bacteriovoracaceae bacterium]|nr:hypothetical protein [Bacteriovoracaceae bacterium]
MLLKRICKIKLLLLIGICSLAGACGKKAKTKHLEAEPYQEPVSVNERFIEKQTVACETDSFCPNYIAKIVAFDGVDYRYCTGFLTDENTIATSSSCLPSLMRREGQDCSRDIFIFFPKTANREAERVSCKSVLKFSPLPGNDPNLWRDDVSFLSLGKTLSYRRQASIKRDGIPNHRFFTTWMVDQQGEYAALIKKSTCQAVHNNYVNPLVSNESSPNMIFADCGLTVGSTGAPVLDNYGKVRAIISKGISQSLLDSIKKFDWLTEPLREMAHGTNFACAPTIYDYELLDEAECTKDMSDMLIANLREQMTSFNVLFDEQKEKLRESLTTKSEYIYFDMKLSTNGNVQNVDVIPKCFKPLSGWLPMINSSRNNYVFDITLPRIQFKKIMDGSGRIGGQVEEGPEKPYYIQFSLKQLKSIKRSFVWMWNSLDNLTFPNMSEQCSESLL